MLFQGTQIVVTRIRPALLRASEVDADEFVGQGAAGLVALVLVPLFLLVIIDSGSGLLPESAAGIFMESLSAEFRTAVTHVSRFEVAPLDHDRGHTVELRHLLDALETIPVGTKGD